MLGVVCSATHAQVKGLKEIDVYPGSAQKWQPADSWLLIASMVLSCVVEFCASSFSCSSFHVTLVKELQGLVSLALGHWCC